MVAAYGHKKTLAGLRAQRKKWCGTRGRNGNNYSALNMGWVDWADQALSGAGPPPQPERPILEPPPLFTGGVPRPPNVPLPRIRRPIRDAERLRSAALLPDEPGGAPLPTPELGTGAGGTPAGQPGGDADEQADRS
jgi:hypothetical protein